MKSTEAMIVWNNQTGEVNVGPWPDKTGWSNHWPRKFRTSYGDAEFAEGLPDLHKMLRDFHWCVLESGIDPMKVHCEFLKIDEYRLGIQASVPGSEGTGGEL